MDPGLMVDGKYDFFLSFRGTDRGLADRIYSILTGAAGGQNPYKVYYQPLKQLGTYHAQEIDEALESSTKIIAVFTPDYLVGSLDTQREFDAGWRSEKLLIFRFGDAKLPPRAREFSHQQLVEDDPEFDEKVRLAARFQPSLPYRTIQLIDGLTTNLPGWKGKSGDELIGRNDELAQLTDAFHDPRCAIVCVIADGGYGKSSLVSRWLADIRNIPSEGAYLQVQAAYAYSFYQQGWENRSVSPNDFFLSCLSHLSGVHRDALSEAGGGTDWPTEIQTLLNSRRSLLVLDGLEPNQKPHGHESEGEIEDKQLKGFIRGIEMRSGGLCVITSRLMPPELKGPAVKTGRVRVIPLRPLGHEASIRVLLDAGVDTDNKDLDFWARESKGHPLLLALLASAIKSGHYKPNEFEAHRVLTENGKTNIPETIGTLVWERIKWIGPEAEAVMLCTCMFEKPPSYEDVRQLLVDRAAMEFVTIPLLTESLLLRLLTRLRLVGLLNWLSFLRPRISERSFRKGAEQLERAAMLVKLEPRNDSRLWTLEAHAVIQAGVRSNLRGERKALWKQANWAIYLGLNRSVKPFQPEKVSQLATIYSAVPHGVNAGKGRLAGWIYALRCLRGYRAYSTNNHGMIADDVSALSHYFEGYWQTLREDVGLDSYARVQAYVWSGALLLGVNRGREGMPLMEKGLALAKEKRFYSAAARTATLLSVGYAIAGELADAESRAREAIRLLQLSQSQPMRIRLMEWRLVNAAFQRMDASATLGNVLHYQGKFEEAEQAFSDAQLYLRQATRFQTLRALWCFWQVELMLDEGKFKAAEWLIQQAMIDPQEPKGWGEGVFCEPLLKLSFVRTYIRQFDMQGESGDREKASDYATDFADFGEKGQWKMDWLVPIFKIALSGVARLEGRLDDAKTRIGEADKRATQSGNRLFEADVRTEQARVHLAANERVEALTRIREAEALAMKIGYRCRLGEISHVMSLCGGV